MMALVEAVVYAAVEPEGYKQIQMPWLLTQGVMEMGTGMGGLKTVGQSQGGECCR
jgi:hypothetical protein